MTICEIVNAGCEEDKLKPGELDLEDWPKIKGMIDDIAALRKAHSDYYNSFQNIRKLPSKEAEEKLAALDAEYNLQGAKQEDGLGILHSIEYGGHSTIIKKYNLKLCHVDVLREFFSSFQDTAKVSNSMYIMRGILLADANLLKPWESSVLHGDVEKKCNENGGCPAKGCEYRAVEHVVFDK